MSAELHTYLFGFETAYIPKALERFAKVYVSYPESMKDAFDEPESGNVDVIKNKIYDDTFESYASSHPPANVVEDEEPQDYNEEIENTPEEQVAF